MWAKEILRRKNHNCTTFKHKRESKKALKEFLSFKQSRESGISPLTVGFIICVPDPLSTVWMNFGDRKKTTTTQKGHLRTFSHTYHGNKEFRGCVTILNSDKDWKTKPFSVITSKDYEERGGLITKFYQTKAAGQSARGSSGLDVAFMISTGRSLKRTIWQFDENKPPHPQPIFDLSTSHIYKRADTYRGSVIVEDYNGKTKTRKFNVIVSNNPRTSNPCCK